MNIWVIVGNIALPVLSVIGIIVIYCHQRSKIGNLERSLKSVKDFMGIFDIEKVKSYSTLGEERAKFDSEKELAKIKAEFDKERGEIEVNVKKVMADYIQLVVLLVAPLAESKYLNLAIRQLPDGIVKNSAERLSDGARQIIKEKGVACPELGKKIDDYAASNITLQPMR